MQQVLQRLHLVDGQLGGVKLQLRRWLITGHRHRRAFGIPAPGIGFRRIIHRVVRLLGGRCAQAVSHMNLVAQLIGIGIADLGAPGKTELCGPAGRHTYREEAGQPSHSANSSG